MCAPPEGGSNFCTLHVLYAQRFDPVRLTPSGSAEVVADDVGALGMVSTTRAWADGDRTTAIRQLARRRSLSHYLSKLHSECQRVLSRCLCRMSISACGSRRSSSSTACTKRHQVERAAALLPVEKIRAGHRRVAELRHARVELHEPVGLRVRQRPQQHRVDDAEHRGIGADAERQRDDRDGGESRRLPEVPRTEGQILKQGFDRSPPVSATTCFGGGRFQLMWLHGERVRRAPARSSLV